MISPPPQRASPPIRVCCFYRRTVNHCVASTFPAWLIGPVAGRSKSVNARAPVTPAPSSWLRDQSGSAQASPVQARRAKISLLGLLKLLWLTGWRCQSFTEHSTKAEASRFISRFKMTWSILRQHKEKPLSRSSTLPSAQVSILDFAHLSPLAAADSALPIVNVALKHFLRHQVIYAFSCCCHTWLPGLRLGRLEDLHGDLPFPLQCNLPECSQATSRPSLCKRPSNVAFISHTTLHMHTCTDAHMHTYTHVVRLTLSLCCS